MSEQSAQRVRLAVAVVGVVLLWLVLCSSALALDTSMRSVADIRQHWSALKPTYAGSPYSSAPHTLAPYAAGSLAPGFLLDGLDAINYARYLAGMPDDVALDDQLTGLAQHGAVLLAASEFSHTPSQPAGMDDAFYQAGYSATSSSNIGAGYESLWEFNVGCMDDSDPSNIDRLGHRRWLLFPALAKTGMGYANERTDTYVFDWSRVEPVDYAAVLWPCAGYFPVQMFSAGTAWSITLNPDQYVIGDGAYTVSLRRIGDGRIWTFTSADTDPSGKYFNVDTQGFGVDNCFIFRPDPASVGSYRVGDVFEVTLSGGVYLADGVTPATISYRTEFMSQETVLPAATVTRPYAPASVRRRKMFSAWGYLMPLHAAGTRAVTLYCSRRVGSAWKVRKTVTATVGDYSTYSRYSVRLSLPSAGRWRIRGYHADAEHRPSYSAWRYLVVR